MSRGRHAFKETDVARAVRAAIKGGIAHPCVEIRPGGAIVIMTGPDPETLPSTRKPADADAALDAELEAWTAEHGVG
jgi:hypothetical protein